MIRTCVSNLLIVLGCIAFAIVGLGPRGAALCIGGGHALGEMIVAACHAGGHSHASHTPAAHVEPHACGHVEAACVLPHEHHSHDGEHAPCADIPLDQDEYRAGSPSTLRDAGHGVLFAASLQAPLAIATSIDYSTAPRPRPGGGATWIASDQTAALLRAVILQV